MTKQEVHVYEAAMERGFTSREAYRMVADKWTVQDVNEAADRADRAHRDYVEHHRDNPHDPIYN